MDTSMTKFFGSVGSNAEHYYYIWIVSCTFLSRERFWHYQICMFSGYLLQMFMKLFIHELRPVYVWNDFLPTACNAQFGSPSGHSIDAFVLSMTIILDLFAPSRWSRKNFPSLNTRNASTCKLAALIFGLAFPYQAFIVLDRLYLGKHALN